MHDGYVLQKHDQPRCSAQDPLAVHAGDESTFLAGRFHTSTRVQEEVRRGVVRDVKPIAKAIYEDVRGGMFVCDFLLCALGLETIFLSPPAMQTLVILEVYGIEPRWKTYSCHH